MCSRVGGVNGVVWLGRSNVIVQLSHHLGQFKGLHTNPCIVQVESGMRDRVIWGTWSQDLSFDRSHCFLKKRRVCMYTANHVNASENKKVWTGSKPSHNLCPLNYHIWVAVRIYIISSDVKGRVQWASGGRNMLACISPLTLLNVRVEERGEIVRKDGSVK